MKFFIFSLFAVALIGCGSASVSTETCIDIVGPVARDPDESETSDKSSLGPAILWKWIGDKDSENGKAVAKIWHPTIEGMDFLIVQAANLAGLEYSVDNFEPYSKHDEGREYILLVYEQNALTKNKLTVTLRRMSKVKEKAKPKTKLAPKEKTETLQQGSDEELAEFYERCFNRIQGKKTIDPTPRAQLDVPPSPAKTDSSLKTTKAQDVGMDIETFKTVFNLYRSQKSLGSVKLNDALNAAAKKWAEVKRDKRKKALKKPGKKGLGPSQFAHQSGYKANRLYTVASRFDVVDTDIVAEKWLFDKKLKKTLTKKNVTDIGLACVEASYDTKKDTITSIICVLLLANEKQDLLDLLREKKTGSSSP